MFVYSSVRAYLPPPLPSVRLTNAGVRTELFVCAGTVMPSLTGEPHSTPACLSATAASPPFFYRYRCCRALQPLQRSCPQDGCQRA